MNVKKIIAAFTAAAALVVSAPFAALPNATAIAAHADYMENGVTSAQADAAADTESCSLKSGTVTATAKVGDTELAGDKVIVNEKDFSVTVVVPNDTTIDQVSATIALTAIKDSDKSEVPLSGTKDDFEWGANSLCVNRINPNSGWFFSVYIVKEQDYKENTVHFSVEIVGFDDDEPDHSRGFIYTTERKHQSSPEYECDFNLRLYDGDKVMTGTKVYIVNDGCISGCSCQYRVYDANGNQIGIWTATYQSSMGNLYNYNYFYVPENGVNICETHTRTYKANFKVNNKEHGTLKQIYNDYEFDIWDLEYGDGTTFSRSNVPEETLEYSLTPDEGYSAVMTVKDADGNIIPVTKGENNRYSFKQPAKEVNVTIDFVKSGQPSGGSVDVEIKAPENVDVSNQTATVTVGGKTETLKIVDGMLDVSGLTDGKYTFTFKANNCAPRAYEVTVSGGTAIGLESGVKLNLYGDINGDGKLTLGDVLKANASARNSKPLTDYDKSIADINMDGKISLGDVLKMNAHARNSKLLW